MSPLPADITLGPLALTISDMDRSLAFYEQRLGLQLKRREGQTAYLGAGESNLLILVEKRGAHHPGRTSGLYHFAILVPNRRELACSLRRIAETDTPVQGFADHWVSEAIYLADPDGNGIEIYRDRPRQEWPRRDGRLQMATDPLDIQDLLAELEGQEKNWPGLHPQTVLGHMHLHVADLGAAENFYRDAIGFDLMMTLAGSASFLSAGGYHHHLGINTWAGVGAPPAPADAVGLRWWTIRFPGQDSLDQSVADMEGQGLTVERRPDGVFLQDPSRNWVRLVVN